MNELIVKFASNNIIRFISVFIEDLTTKTLGLLSIFKLRAQIPNSHLSSSCRWSTLIKNGKNISIGKNTRIGPNCVLGATGRIIIGQNVVISREVQLETAGLDFSVGPPYTKHKSHSITIEDNCWLGSGVMILGGVKIGENSIIGAGTIVTKDIPANSVIVGAKFRNIK